MSECRFGRESKTHLTRGHRPECVAVDCKGCAPCLTDDAGIPVRHCRTRSRCTSHLGWTEQTCPECLSKIRGNLTAILEGLALMPAEAIEQGINSEPANLAGPHADYVSAQWRLINADRAGLPTDELDMRDPYTCLTMHERTIREDLGHDEETLVSGSIAASAGYLAWVLTDLARTEDGVLILASLLGDTSRLRMHIEGAMRDGKTPERGIPCPACVEAEREPQRLRRVYAHWCWKDGCTKDHYLDDSGDTWVCPVDPEHEWTHAAHEGYLVERTSGKASA